MPLDAEGKEIGWSIVVEGEQPPPTPEGGKVKPAPLSLDVRDFALATAEAA
jgi:type I restriction enzyme M protein